MIRIEIEDFTVDVPIERRMSVAQFLAVADRLERLFGQQLEMRPLSAHEEALPSGFSSTQHEHYRPRALDEFRFEREEEARVEYLMNKLLHKLEAIEVTQSRLEQLETHLLGPAK